MDKNKINNVQKDMQKSNDVMRKDIGGNIKQPLVNTNVNNRAMTEDPEINMMTEDPEINIQPGKTQIRKC